MRLIRAAALEVRLLDRIFDNDVMGIVQKAVNAALHGNQVQLESTLAEVRPVLDMAYAWLDTRLTGSNWAAGDDFSLADCAAAPALSYADWFHEIGADFTRLRAYRARLLARPSFARAFD